MRLIYLAILISITTLTFYFKDGLLLGFFGEGENPVVRKKVSVVKPKFLVDKAEALKPVSHQFTFFETLNDKTLTKYVGLHGEILPVSSPAKPVFLFKEKATRLALLASLMITLAAVIAGNPKAVPSGQLPILIISLNRLKSLKYSF